MLNSPASENPNYQLHIAARLRVYEEALGAEGFDAAIIASGTLNCYPFDDQNIPFRPNPFFAEWLPATQRTDHYLLVERGAGRPKLFYRNTDDYWHTPLPELPPGISSAFDWQGIKTDSEISKYVQLESIAFLGPEDCLPDNINAHVNPTTLIQRLDWHRAFKSQWEIECIREANRIAALGHTAVRKAFYDSDGDLSEYDLNMLFLSAVRSSDREQPYDNIIGLNENAAVLHHFMLDKQCPSALRSILIDAGAAYHGYSADISRTWCREDGLFANLLAAMDTLQLRIVDSIQPGMPYADLHQLSQRLIANLLREASLVNDSEDAILDSGLIRSFYPHGIGHLLGIQVHDRGAHVISADGALSPSPLGTGGMFRPIESGHVFTVEPGIYFIPQLLDRERNGKQAGVINWSLIETLIPYGGIRIEDNIVVGEKGIENITRQFLP